MLKWRKMTWVVLAWCALIIVWVIAGANNAQNNANCDSEPEHLRQLCRDATDIGTGIGVMFVMAIGFVGFVFFSIIWFMTRPKPEPIIHYVTADAPVPQTAARPAPPRAPKPAGWYRDPGGRFDWRYYDRGWTDDVANDGDDNTYIDPVPRR